MQPQQISALIVQTILDCTSFFQSAGWVPSDWKCDVIIDFSKSRARSWGWGGSGCPPMINVSAYQFCNKPFAEFHEYPSFKDDPDIGTVIGSTESAIKALVIHEMCHTIQSYQPNYIPASVGIRPTQAFSRKIHNATWKALYRATRIALLHEAKQESASSL